MGHKMEMQQLLSKKATEYTGRNKIIDINDNDVRELVNYIVKHGAFKIPIKEFNEQFGIKSSKIRKKTIMQSLNTHTDILPENKVFHMGLTGTSAYFVTLRDKPKLETQPIETTETPPSN